MGGPRRSPPKAPRLWSPLALPLLLTSAVPRAAEPIEPEGSPPPAAVPLLRLEPGWGRLQQRLGLPAWVDLDLEVLAELMGNPAGGLVSETTWIQQTTLALSLRVPTGPARSPGREWDRWAMLVAIASFNGDPLYAQRLGAVLPLQEVANPVVLPWGLDHRLWAAAAAGLDTAVNPTPSSIGGGLVSQGVLPGRPFDLLILGVARTGFSPITSPGLSHEGVVELGYQLRINQSFNLQPSLKWIIHPGGAGRIPRVFAAGLQLGLSF